MRPFLGLTSILCFVVAIIGYLASSTIMGQTASLVLAAIGTMCGIAVHLINFIEHQSVETRRLIERISPPQQ